MNVQPLPYLKLLLPTTANVGRISHYSLKLCNSWVPHPSYYIFGYMFGSGNSGIFTKEMSKLGPSK